jgi:tRNA(fMet)-specific endonuclease VapC
MSFLIDTDICSAHMRRPAMLAHRFVQYTGQIAISAVTLAELYSGAHKHSQTPRLLTLIADLLQEVTVVDFDAACAESFGRVRGVLLRGGIAVPTADLMIASAALVHNLTLVTHNSADYQRIPGLRLEDWLAP